MVQTDSICISLCFEFPVNPTRHSDGEPAAGISQWRWNRAATLTGHLDIRLSRLLNMLQRSFSGLFSCCTPGQFRNSGYPGPFPGRLFFTKRNRIALKIHAEDSFRSPSVATGFVIILTQSSLAFGLQRFNSQVLIRALPQTDDVRRVTSVPERVPGRPVVVSSCKNADNPGDTIKKEHAHSDRNTYAQPG